MVKKNVKFASLALIAVFAVALVYFVNQPTSEMVTLTMTSSKTSYSVSNGDLATFRLNLPLVGGPFEVTYYLNGAKFYVATSVEGNSFDVGIRASDGSWSLIQGQNTLSFTVKDSSNKMYQSNTVSFMVIP